MKVDPRFLTEGGPEIFTGNELVIKGALEADGGVHLLGGYPGSPIAGFFDTMPLVGELLKAHGIHAVMNNNEALAAAMLNGSQVAGCRAIIAMKSVGVHVAADALAIGSLAGAHRDGGAVIIYGDDPWSDSTQVPADSRFISRHLFIPVVEPANPQEVKDFVDLSLKLSRLSELYVGLVLTNNLADGGGSVMCRPNQFPTFNTRQRLTMETAKIDLDKYVLLPPRTWFREEKYPARFAKAVAVARELKLNRIDYPADSRRPLGIATSGLAYGYLIQALWEMGLLGQIPILKFGMSYPLDTELVRQFAGMCQRIVVVEERRAFLEEQIADAILKAQQDGGDFPPTEVWGKQLPDGLAGIPSTRGLDPSIITARLAPLLKKIDGQRTVVSMSEDIASIDRELETLEATAQAEIRPFPPRQPTFCPGCPHRDSASLCLEIRKRFADADYMRRVHKCGPVDLVFHGDTGCYTMLMFPPNAPLMHNYSGMGLGGGTGSGMDPFITNKQAVFLGDSTFFHSGQIAISQAIKLGQDITFIILDNSTTGMTGHQPTPGVDYDILGNPTAVQDIEQIVTGLGGGNVGVVRADPEKRKEYAALLERTLLADGVKVVIADKECGITRNRRKQRAERVVSQRLGYLPQWEHMNVNQEICTFCLACTELTGCPGLKHVQTDYGRKMDTDLTWCVNDGACHRIGACSSFEHVTIKRKRPPRSRVPELGLDDIPEPQKRPAGAVWRCCLVGVGSQGIGTATQILVRAGHKEGYNVLFLDKKGLAIRNGGVVSQVVYNISNQPITPVIPYGKADLLVGLDVLEAARILDPKGRTRLASSENTAAVINTGKLPTIRTLMGQDDFDPDELEQMIRAHTRSADYLARNISRICEKYLGSKLFANSMMLGFAFQKGLIPVSMHSMAWAIKGTIRVEFRKNLYAFNMGRKLVMDADLFAGPPRRTDWGDLLEEKCRWTIRRYRRGQQMAAELRELVAGEIDSMSGLDSPLKSALVVRAYDCMRWGGLSYARRYVQSVAGVYRKDKAEYGYQATSAAIHTLGRSMLIKDAFFIAELATAGEKRAADREKYNVNPANGDKIVYRHLLHGHFNLLGYPLRLDLSVPSWVLSGLKRLTFLRKVLPLRKEDREFLRQYQQTVDNFSYSNEHDYQRAVAQLSSPQCLACINPRCREAGCPLGSEIPRWVELACQGQWPQAAKLLASANNFPEFTSLLCPAPCQVSCKQAIGADLPVQVRELERQIVEQAFAENWFAPQITTRRSGRKAAVIGSGPAGLAAAQQLARSRHDVTVFEKDARAGGLLRYGIPDFRLDKKILDRRLEQLSAEGVTFKTGVEVGRGISAADLLGQFDAIVLATGASRPRDLSVPGRQQEGIYYAMDFLRQENLRSQGQYISESAAITAKGKVVAVIGGGLTGEDCVETAMLQGAKKVHQFEILPRQATANGAASPGSAKLAAGQQVSRQYCAVTKQFGGDGRRLSEIHGAKVRWLESDVGSICQELPNSAFRVRVDMAVLAMGFEPGLDGKLAKELGLETDQRGRVVHNEGVTSNPGVFVAGDVASGASYIAAAINSGRLVAAKVNDTLNKMSNVE